MKSLVSVSRSVLVHKTSSLSVSLILLVGTVIILTSTLLDLSSSSSSRSICSAFQITSSISGPPKSSVNGRTNTRSGWVPTTLSTSTTQLYMSTTSNRQQQNQQQQNQQRRRQQQQPTNNNSKRRTLYGEYQRLFRGENDFYNILGITTCSNSNTVISMDDIKKAYKQKAKEYHPDVNRNNGIDTTNEFQLINRAYQVLSDPQRKERYDTAMQYYKNEQIQSHLKGLDEYEKTFYTNTNPSSATSTSVSIQSNESKYMQNVMDIQDPLWQTKVTKSTSTSKSTPYTSTPYTSMYIDTKYYKFGQSLSSSSTNEISSTSFTSAVCDQDATGTGLPFTPNYNYIHYHKQQQQQKHQQHQQNQQNNQHPYNNEWNEKFQQPLSGVGSTSHQEKATDIGQIVDDFFGWSGQQQQQQQVQHTDDDSTSTSMYHLNDVSNQETITGSTTGTIGIPTTGSSAIVSLLNSNIGNSNKNDDNDATDTDTDNAVVNTASAINTSVPTLGTYPMIPTSISSFVPQEEEEQQQQQQITTTTSSITTNSNNNSINNNRNNNNNNNKYNTNNGSIIPMKTTTTTTTTDKDEEENTFVLTGDDLIFDYEIDYRTSIFGTEDIVYIKHYETCYNCLGSGIKPGTEIKHTCRSCGGTGMKLNINKNRNKQQQIQTTSIGTFITETQENDIHNTAYETCSNCFGLGYTIKGEHCDTCCENNDDTVHQNHHHHHDTSTASGLIEVIKRIKVIIPPKRKNGDIICVKGEGNAGSYGISPGNLYIQLLIDTENNDSNIWYTSTGTSFDYMSINEYQRISVQTPTILRSKNNFIQ